MFKNGHGNEDVSCTHLPERDMRALSMFKDWTAVNCLRSRQLQKLVNFDQRLLDNSAIGGGSVMY